MVLELYCLIIQPSNTDQTQEENVFINTEIRKNFNFNLKKIRFND